MTRSTLLVILAALCLSACVSRNDSDQKQQVEQESLLAEATSQVGMPAIKNFRERKIVRQLFELRDQNGLSTYTYVFSAPLGKYVYLGPSVGYAIPAATQFTSPEKVVEVRTGDFITTPQADPNGLFSPSSAEGSWVMMLNPTSAQVEPQYMEERLTVTTYKLPARIVAGGYPEDANTL